MPSKNMTPFGNLAATDTFGGSATWVLSNNKAAVWQPGDQITYSFDATMDAAEQAFVRMAMDMWQDIAGISFVSQASGGRITIGYDPNLAYNPFGFTAGYVDHVGTAATTLRINQAAYDGSLSLAEVGSNGTATSAFFTVVHELGHVLGFHHPGPYNGEDANVSQAVYFQDTTGYTVMSYWRPDMGTTQYFTPVDFDYFGNKAVGPQILDMVAAQYLYGANMTTRTGDDTYFFNSNLPAASPWSFEGGGFFGGALWDAGGYDTLDLSGVSARQRVDLRDPKPGAGALYERLLVEDLGTFNDVMGYKANLFIPGIVQIERVIGGRGKDEFIARDGVDTTLDGRDGADTLSGGTGNDFLDAGEDAFADDLAGGAGADSYRIWAGDRIIDTSGPSLVDIFDSMGADAVTIDLSASDDTVTVHGLIDVIALLGGGIDSYAGGDGRDAVDIIAGGTTIGRGDAIDLGAGNDSLVARLIGPWGDGIDVFDGGADDDTFQGLFEVDLVLTDLSTGVTSFPSVQSAFSLVNFEHISFAGARAVVTSWGQATLTETSITTSGLADEVAIDHDSAFTQVHTGEGDDLVNGDIDRTQAHDFDGALDRIIRLGGGNDRYVAGAMSQGTHDYDGGDGIDTLDLGRLLEIGWGSTSLYARSAADLSLTIDQPGGTIAGLFTTFDSIGTSPPFAFAAQFSNFERFVIPLAGTVRFTGNALADTEVTLSGGGMIDARIVLGAGNDTVALREFRPDADQPVMLLAGGGRDTLDLSGLAGQAGSFPAFITETVTVDRRAGLVSRYLESGSGRTVTASVQDFEVFRLADFSTGGSLDARTVLSRFVGIDGVDEVFGGARNDTIEGRGGNDTMSGGGDEDRLDGGTGADRMAGGTGNDTYIVDNAADVVIEAIGEGTMDRVFTSVTHALALAAEIEMIATNNAAGTSAIDLTGNGFVQTVIGNDGVNRLDGKGGADTLQGRGGSDIYVVDNAGDVIVEFAGQGGLDQVFASVSYVLGAAAQVEVLRTTNGTGTDAINLTGNAFAQTIIGNDGVNRLDGRAGADTLEARAGSDIYVVDNAGDVIVEGDGQGLSDQVFAGVSYALGAAAWVETLQTTSAGGAGAINLVGNGFAQTIIGNAGASVIDGKGGSDTLRGLGGSDIFAFTTALGADNVDRILDYDPALDTIRLDRGIFAGLAAGTLLHAQFHIGTGAADGSDRIIYDPTTGELSFDADGSGAAAQLQFAILAKSLALTANEFQVV